MKICKMVITQLNDFFVEGASQLMIFFVRKAGFDYNAEFKV